MGDNVTDEITYTICGERHPHAEPCDLPMGHNGDHVGNSPTHWYRIKWPNSWPPPLRAEDFFTKTDSGTSDD